MIDADFIEMLAFCTKAVKYMTVNFLNERKMEFMNAFILAGYIFYPCMEEVSLLNSWY